MPTVCLEKTTPKNNIARKEYNKLIGELNNEIDRLSTQNKSLIEKLSITEDQIAVGRRNERDLDEHRHEIDLIEEETKRLRIQLDDAIRLKIEAEKEIQKLNMERENLERTLSDAQKKCHTMDTSERDMRNIILRAEEDKKRLAQRIEKLTANERALVLELERLKRHGGTSDGRTKRISQLDEFITGIEADRDYWRGQVELLQQMLNYPTLSSGTDGGGIGRTTASSRLKSKPPTGQHITTSKLGGPIKDTKQRKLEQQVQELRVERDLLRQELDSATRSRHRSPSPVTRSRSLNRFQTRDDYMELTKLRQERDELRSLLNKLEHRVQEIQRNVHTLTQERDQINKLYNDSRCEIHRLHQDLYAMHETGDRNTQTTQTVLRRVEAERDRALVDLSRVTAERDSLITKYKNSTENAHSDKLRLTNQLDHLENSLNQVAEERDEAVNRVSVHRLRIDELQQRQQQLEDSLAERQELLKKVNEESAQLKQEAELQNNRLEERELQISQMNERTRVMEIDCRRMHERIDEYDMKLRKERDECIRLRNLLQNTEEEKVKLQCDVDGLTCERDDLIKYQRQIEKRAQINLSERDRLSRQVNDLNELKDNLEKQLRQIEKDYSDQSVKYQVSITKIRILHFVYFSLMLT
ncbi:Centrosomal protein [Schistosoma japonicum]|nr:Centrosomal protein [Schistosoma japonicum]